MRIFKVALGFALCLLLGSCGKKEPERAAHLTPPSAAKKAKVLDENGHQRTDDYSWLSNPKDLAVLALLDAENDYATKMLQHTEGVQNKLFDEMNSREEQTKTELPVKENGYWHYRRFEPNQSFPLVCRKKDDWQAAEQIILNIPELAKSQTHFELADVAVSPDNNYVAYLVDLTGERRHVLYIKNLATGKLSSEKITNVASQALAWSGDSKSVFYVLVDETVRGFRAMRHVLGSDTKNDKVVFEEKNKSYVLSIVTSRSRKYVFIGSFSNNGSEIRFLDVQKVDAAPTLVQQRQPNLQYQVEHYDGNEFFIQNNRNAPNNKLSVTPDRKSVV